MSQKKRKLGYWGIEFVNGDETYFDSSLFENFIEYVKGLDSVQLLQRDPQNSKAISLDKIWTTSSQGRRLYEVRFKSCKYNHSPDYMSSRDGTERPTEKQLYEGDKELTHLCLRIDTDEAFCVIEERKSGVTLGAVVRYFNMLLRNYLLSQGNEMPIVLFASIVPSEDFMSALNSAEKITIAELFVQKDVMGSGYLNYLDVDASTREDVVMTVKAKPRQSFTKRALRDTYIKMTTEGTEIKRIRLRGKDVNQMSVVIDSLNAKRKDEVYVELDQSGIVISSSIFSKMEEAIMVEATEE